MIKLAIVVVAAALSLLLLFPFTSSAFTSSGSLVVCYHRRPCSRHYFDRRLPAVAAVADDDADYSSDDDDDDDDDDKTPDGTGGADIFTRHSNLGLLRGVNLSIDRFYANEIDMTREGLAWLDQPGLLWEAATKDAVTMNVSVDKYIKRIEANLEAFRVSDIIYNRKVLLENLNKYVKGKGAFALILGGKNVGKSTVLQSLAKKNSNQGSEASVRRRPWAFLARALQFIKGNNRSMQRNKSSPEPPKVLVLYLDAGKCPGRLDVGLANGVAKLAAERLTRKPRKIGWVGVARTVNLGSVAAIEQVLERIPGGETEKAQLREVVAKIKKLFLPPSTDIAEVTNSLLEIFITMAEDEKAFPVLIIDEANFVLGKQDDQTNIILTNIATSTKQDNKLSLIMASSEHAYPYRLEREGFDLDNVKRVVFAGEIPPREMLDFLLSARYNEGDSKGEVIVGMGPHLAELCLAAYGGHFFNVELAVQGLSSEREGAEASSFLPTRRTKILDCLDTDTSITRPLLEAMAQYGFAPIEKTTNPAAALISEMNIGGIVTKKGLCIGVPKERWKGIDGDEIALIPSLQCIRLEIAKALLKRPLPSDSTAPPPT